MKNKSSDFWLQSAWDKFFWRSMIANSKWWLILKFSFRRIFKVVSHLTNHLSFSNTALHRKDIRGAKSSLYNCVYSRSKSTHLFSISPSAFWRACVFLTSTEHIVLVRSMKLPKNLGYGNTHTVPYLRSKRLFIWHFLLKFFLSK